VAGLYIGGAFVQEGVGLRGGGQNRMEGRDSVLGRNSWPKDRDDTRAPRVTEERQGRRYRFGAEGLLGLGRFLAWAS
jgi:hypothetical protein